MRRRIGLAIAAALLSGAAAAAEKPRIVAAENFYGDLAQQIAGPDAEVSSLLTNPDQDPHLFEASPKVARALADADVVIANGADYDPWVLKLLGHGRARVIVAADLVGKRPGDNPHLWYATATMRAIARALTDDLIAADPVHRCGYASRAAAFAASLDTLDARIAALRARHTGVAVTATEPVFGVMAEALGLVMRNEGFQRAVMNDTEPSVSDVAGFEADLRQHRVRALLYNSQVSDAATTRLLAIAHEAGVPVVGVSETEPADTTYVAWMIQQLDTLDRALTQPSPPA